MWILIYNLYMYIENNLVLKINDRCYLKLGDWADTLYGVNEESVTQILEYYSLATEYDKYWYKVSQQRVLY